MKTTNTSRQIEALLKVSLPESVSEIEYDKHQPNPAYTYQDTHIRLKLPETDFMALVKQLKLKPLEDTPYMLMQPGIWKLKSQIHLDWWSDTPGEKGHAFAISAGEGWILAKYAGGYGYLYVYNPD